VKGVLSSSDKSLFVYHSLAFYEKLVFSHYLSQQARSLKLLFGWVRLLIVLTNNMITEETMEKALLVN